MLLHTFAHIVRGALLNWWTALDPEAVEPTDVEAETEAHADADADADAVDVDPNDASTSR